MQADPVVREAAVELARLLLTSGHWVGNYKVSKVKTEDEAVQIIEKFFEGMFGEDDLPEAANNNEEQVSRMAFESLVGAMQTAINANTSMLNELDRGRRAEDLLREIAKRHVPGFIFNLSAAESRAMLDDFAAERQKEAQQRNAQLGKEREDASTR